MVVPSPKGCLRDVTISDYKLIVPGSEVYLRKPTRRLKLVKQFIYPRDGILIIDYDFVQLMIVNAHPEKIVFLSHEQY